MIRKIDKERESMKERKRESERVCVCDVRERERERKFKLHRFSWLRSRVFFLHFFFLRKTEMDD